MTHAILAVVIIACVLVVEKVLSVTAVGDHLIVDVVPMRYLFDLIDVAVIGVFGFYGVRDLIRELNE